MVAPLELFVRASWVGVQTVIIIGMGSRSYAGWSYGLYLSLVAGFIAAGWGSAAVWPFLDPAPRAPDVQPGYFVPVGIDPAGVSAGLAVAFPRIGKGFL